MKRLRKPPASRAVAEAFFLRKPEVLRRGPITASALLYGRNGTYIRITLNIKGNGSRMTQYYARLVGRKFVVMSEGGGADVMPPYIGRQFATHDELNLLMRQMLAAYIMVHT